MQVSPNTIAPKAKRVEKKLLKAKEVRSSSQLRTLFKESSKEVKRWDCFQSNDFLMSSIQCSNVWWAVEHFGQVFFFPFIWSSWVERMPPIQTWIPAGKASSWPKKIAFKKREEFKLVYWFSLSYRPRFESQNLLKIVALKIYISVRMDSPFFGIMNLNKISKL